MEDFLVLDFVHRGKTIPSKFPELKNYLKNLVDLGVIERMGQGRGTKYMLCRQYYKIASPSGMYYTERRGLDEEVPNLGLTVKRPRRLAKP